MFDDIAKIDRVLKPEPLRINANRDRSDSQKHDKGEPVPVPANNTLTEDPADEGEASHALDIRI